MENDVGCNVAYSPEHDCLICTIAGDLNLEKVGDCVKQITEEAKKNNCKCLLNDLRRANLDLSIVDLYMTAEKVISKELDRSWRRAIVVDVDSEKAEFYETTAHNRGLSIRIFNDIDEALKWLKAGSGG